MKKYLKILIILFLVFFSFSAFARQLEVDYPGAEFSTTATQLSVYIKYIYTFILSIIGIIAFLILIFGGLGYIASSGNPEKLTESKKKVISSFLGLLIIVSSYIILETIYPPFVGLKGIETSPTETKVKREKSPILLCKEEIEEIDTILDIETSTASSSLIQERIEENCFFVGTSKNYVIPEEWRNPEIIYVFPDTKTPVNEKKNFYGAVFFVKDQGEMKRGQIVYNIEGETAEEGDCNLCTWRWLGLTWILSSSECSFPCSVCSEPSSDGFSVGATTTVPCSTEPQKIEKFIPMDSPIYYAFPFLLSPSPSFSYDFPRSIKLYQYQDGKRNFRNLVDRDPMDCGAYLYDNPKDKCYGYFSTTEEKPIKEFILKKKDLNIRSISFEPPELRTLAILYHHDCLIGCGEEDNHCSPPTWKLGSSCQIYVVDIGLNNIQESARMMGKTIQYNKIGGLMVIAGTDTLFLNY